MNGRDLTLGLVGALAVGAALGRRGSRSLDASIAQYMARFSNRKPLVERVYDDLIAQGGQRGEDGYGLHGPAPLGHLILTGVEDEDGDPGVWINWIEGTRGQRGAWAMVESALVRAGASFAAGETAFDDVFRGWKKRGFSRISQKKAESIYWDTEPGNRYFLKFL
jgi:hypothetical protein